MENSLWSQYIPGENDTAFKEITSTLQVPQVDTDLFTYVIHSKWDAEMKVVDFF